MRKAVAITIANELRLREMGITSILRNPGSWKRKRLKRRKIASDENIRSRVSVLVLIPDFKQTAESRTTASFWQ